MITREAQESTIRLAKQFPVVAITGARQTGKTTLAQLTFPQKKYVNFDDTDTLNIAKNNPKDFIIALNNGAIIDEAQKLPEIFDAIKLHVDTTNSKPGKFILTGSSQFKLKENISDSLAGRIGIINLAPLSISELKNESILKENFYENLLYGFYPPLHDETKKFNRDDWYKNYVSSYLNLDVKDNINPSNLNQFQNFLISCAHHSGKVLNVESITNKLGISAVTGKTWLSILASSFIVHLVYPKFSNHLKSIVKKPKLYFNDTGLLCHLLRINTVEDLLLSPYKGAIVETAAISEIIKSRSNKGYNEDIYYLRVNNNYEVDVIANWDKNYAIEVKSTTTETEKTERQLLKVDEILHEAHIKKIYYTGDITTNSSKISYISWRDW